MFLIERLIGIGIYSGTLVLVCLLIAFSNISSKALLRFYTFALCVMAFFYTPYTTADLYRIFQTMEWYSTMSFSYFFETYVATSSVASSRLLFWLIGKSGLPHLLPVVSAAVSYSLIFYTIHKTQNRYAISRENTALALFLLMTTSIYISVIGGIRMMLAMAIIVFCFFRESVEQKFRWYHIPLYAVALLMHNMAFILFALRLLCIVLDSRKKRIVRVVYALVIGVGGLGALFVFDDLVFQIFDNASDYLFGASYSDPWEYLIGILLLLGFVVLMCKFRPYISRFADIRTYHIGAILGAAVAVAFCFVFSIFYRFIGHLVPILCLPVLMIVLQESQNSYNPRRFRQLSLQSIVALFGALILLLSCARGSLSSLKFFTLS